MAASNGFPKRIIFPFGQSKAPAHGRTRRTRADYPNLVKPQYPQGMLARVKGLGMAAGRYHQPRHLNHTNGNSPTSRIVPQASG